MRVWRLCGAQHREAAFSGQGGLYAARRWNERGHLIVYTATSRALAAVEYFVNLEPHQAPEDLLMAEAEVPDSLVQKLGFAELPEDWFTLNNRDCRRVGTDWLKTRRSVGLMVPSVPVRGDWNVILNPAHPKFSRVKLIATTPFFYDPRMFRR